MSSSEHSRSATLTGCIALLVWATSFPFIRRVAEDIGSLTVAGIEYAVSGLLMLAYTYHSGRFKNFSFLKNKEFYLRVAFYAAYIALEFIAIGLVSRDKMPVVTLLNYLWPTMTMLFSVWLLRQPFRAKFFAIGTIVVLSGLGLEIVGETFFSVVTDTINATTAIAYCCMFVGAACWGLYSTVSRKWGALAGESAALPLIMLTTAAVVFALRGVFHETGHMTSGAWLPLIYLCLMPLVANICWDIGVRRGNIMMLSLLGDGIPWLSLFILHLYLDVEIGLRSIISAILIVTGALISRYSLRVS